MKLAFKLQIIFSLTISAAFTQTPALTIPDFKFYKLDQIVFTNKDLEANKVLFFFFFDADCEHCQHAMTNLNQHYQEYKRAAIYLISLDDKKNVTLLQDTKNEFIDKFKPRRYPSMFLYSAEKKLIGYEDNEESMFRFSKQINTPAR